VPKLQSHWTILCLLKEGVDIMRIIFAASIMFLFFQFNSFYDFDQNSVNARYQTIPYPWLVFGEKVKVNAVFIRDSTGVSDSILILFGGALSNGIQVVS
jgi:hypothetical protein